MKYFIAIVFWMLVFYLGLSFVEWGFVIREWGTMGRLIYFVVALLCLYVYVLTPITKENI